MKKLRRVGSSLARKREDSARDALSMRQLAVADWLGLSGREDRSSAGVEVYDLFCGAGGFSEGARQAGCTIVFACDSDPEAIRVHDLNHPNAVHWCCALPANNIPFPSDERAFHVHGSPPCQSFSSAGPKDDHGDGPGSDLIRWYLGTALSCGATSWSMEQVVSPHVMRILEAERKRNRRRLDFGVFDFYELGVPQHRRRVVAGSPHLVARLKRLRESGARSSVRAAINVGGWTHVQANMYHLGCRRRGPSEKQTKRRARNVYKKAGPLDCWLPVSGPGPTIIAGRGSGWWVRHDPCGRVVRVPLRICDNAALQTFPSGYLLSRLKADSMRLVGNAVPPRVARLMMSGDARPTAAAGSR